MYAILISKALRLAHVKADTHYPYTYGPYLWPVCTVVKKFTRIYQQFRTKYLYLLLLVAVFAVRPAYKGAFLTPVHTARICG